MQGQAKEITEGLREGLKGRGEVVEADTFRAAAMQLELYGDPDVFEIVTDVTRPLLLYEQPKGFAEWRWWVTPKKRGKHELRLRITGQTVTENGVLGDIAFDPIVKTISVTVGAAYVTRKAAKWAVPLIASVALGAIVGGYAQKNLFACEARVSAMTDPRDFTAYALLAGGLIKKTSEGQLGDVGNESEWVRFLKGNRAGTTFAVRTITGMGRCIA